MAAVLVLGSGFGLINEYRAENGLLPLSHDAELSRRAQSWAEHLAFKETIYHSDMSWVPVGMSVGENVGFGPDEQTIISAYKFSAQHNANMLRPWTRLGVGRAENRGTVYMVHLFASDHVQPSPQPAPTLSPTTTQTTAPPPPPIPVPTTQKTPVPTTVIVEEPEPIELRSYVLIAIRELSTV